MIASERSPRQNDLRFLRFKIIDEGFLEMTAFVLISLIMIAWVIFTGQQNDQAGLQNQLVKHCLKRLHTSS